MDRNLFTAAEIVWIICALSPVVTAVLLKINKLTKIKFFAMGMAAAFLTVAITLVLGIVTMQFVFAILPLAFVLMCGIYFSGCLDDSEALSLSLGMSQLFLAFQGFWAALSIDEIMHTGCHDEIVQYHNPAAFIAAALARTAAALLIAFAVKKIFASEKLSRTKTIVLSSAVSAAGLAADVCIIICFI